MKITWKKALLLALFVLVLTALFVVGANAATLDGSATDDTSTAVARLGDDAFYTTLHKAIDAANAGNGGTITLLNDAELTSSVTLSKSITLYGKKSDTENYTITANGFTTGITLFQGSASVTLTFENVDLNLTGTNAETNIIDGCCNVVVTNSHLTSSHRAFRLQQSCNMTVTNSTIEGGTVGIGTFAGGTRVFTITDSRIDGAGVGIDLNNGTKNTVTITNSIIKSTGSNAININAGNNEVTIETDTTKGYTIEKTIVESSGNQTININHSTNGCTINITGAEVKNTHSTTNFHAIHIAGYTTYQCKPNITIDSSILSSQCGSAIRFANNSYISATITIQNNSTLSSPLETIFLGASGTNTITIDNSIVKRTSNNFPISVSSVQADFILKNNAQIYCVDSSGAIVSYRAINFGSATTVRSITFDGYTGKKIVAANQASLSTAAVCNIYFCDDLDTAKTNAGSNGIVFTYASETAAAIRAQLYIVTLESGMYTVGGQFDTTAIDAAISGATNAMNGVTVQTLACVAGLGNKYVLSQDVLDTLTAAITAAQTARNSDYIDQNALDAAAQTLQAAITAFEPNVKIGTDHVDEGEKDHICDNTGCGAIVGVHADSDFDNDHVCDHCGQSDNSFKPHVDEDKDHNCDNGCNVLINKDQCKDENEDHYCDYGDACSEYFGTHADSDTDNDHLCDYCGERMEDAGCTPNADDGDCTTAITCSVCGEVTTAAKTHTPGADDGDCTTAVKCANAGCTQDVIAAKTHTPGTDDNDCTTAVKCANAGCTQDTTAAKTHTPGADDGDCTTAVKCVNAGCTQDATAAKTHTGTDDGDCTTAVKCANAGCTQDATAAKDAHTGGSATCQAKAKCTVCQKEYGDLAAHTYDNDADATCNVCGAERDVDSSASGNENNANNNGKDSEKEGLSGGAIAGIVVGAVVVLGGGGFALFWFVIKKKKI